MNPGGAIFAWLKAWGQAAHFAAAAAAAACSSAAYTARGRGVALKQIYSSAWQVLPGFTLLALLLGLVVIRITVSAARDFGLAPYALELVFRALVLEVIPMLTALFVALRSGAAISTEVALMQVSGELDQMRAANLDPLEREFVPRIAGAAVSVVSLTILACAVVLAVAYLVMYGLSPWGFDEYTRTLARVFDLPALCGFALKCLAFGLAVAVIPIAAGLDATRQAESAPLAVMGGMVRVFSALGLIEVLSLAVKYV